MSWFGKVIGGAFGFLMGGPLGALLGTAVGHRFDQKGRGFGLPGLDFDPSTRQRIQIAFYTATFSVMGHIAKADGRVTEAEIATARSIMGRMELSEEMRRTAIKLYTDGKRSDFPLIASLEQFRQECLHRHGLIHMFIEIQLEAALADGALHEVEERILLQICDQLRFSRFEFHTIKSALEAQLRVAGGWSQRTGQNHRATRESLANKPSLPDAYAALGVRSNASDNEIKRAYRRMMSQHHPDKLVANGLPAEMVQLANEKTQQIRQAWEIVRQARKL